MKTAATLTISLPPGMQKALERLSKEENRTQPDLMREALSLYIESRFPVEIPTKAELAAIEEGREAYRRGEFITLSELINELEPARHKTRAKKTRKAPPRRST